MTHRGVRSGATPSPAARRPTAARLANPGGCRGAPGRRASRLAHDVFGLPINTYPNRYPNRYWHHFFKGLAGKRQYFPGGWCRCLQTHRSVSRAAPRTEAALTEVCPWQRATQRHPPRRLSVHARRRRPQVMAVLCARPGRAATTRKPRTGTRWTKLAGTVRRVRSRPGQLLGGFGAGGCYGAPYGAGCGQPGMPHPSGDLTKIWDHIFQCASTHASAHPLPWRG